MNDVIARFLIRQAIATLVVTAIMLCLFVNFQCNRNSLPSISKERAAMPAKPPTGVPRSFTYRLHRGDVDRVRAALLSGGWKVMTSTDALETYGRTVASGKQYVSLHFVDDNVAHVTDVTVVMDDVDLSTYNQLYALRVPHADGAR